MEGLDVGNPTRSRALDTVHARLRAVTRLDHEAVDAAFARFDLTQVDGYRAFLRAHARVLPALERQLQPRAMLAHWTGRTAALVGDLHALDVAPPPAVPVDLPAGQGAAWGALYVVEGSRLGGTLIARGIAPELPVAYLSAAHGSGGWKRIVGAIEAAASGPTWLDEAIAGARVTFAAYRAAADGEVARG